MNNRPTPSPHAYLSRQSFMIVCALLLMGGCIEETGAPGWSVRVDSLPGVARWVVNTPPEQPAAPGWSLVEELRLGSEEDGSPQLFGQIRGLQVLGDGRIAVLEAISKEVRVFDEEGAHVATWGGEGEGPGEFTGPFGLMLGSEGLLWIPDMRARRMSVIHPDSGFQQAFPMPLYRYRYFWSGGATEDGHVVKPSVNMGDRSQNLLRVYDRNMNQVDSLPMPAPPEVDRTDPPGAFYWEAPNGAGMGYISVPFFPLGDELVDAGGRIWSIGHGDFSYRVKRWEPGGDTLLVVESQRPAISIPSQVRDSAIASVREQLLARGAANQDWSKVPETYPSVTSIFVGDAGDLWVEIPTAGGRFVYDRFDPEGAYQGSIETELRFMKGLRPVVRGDHVWAVVTDEMDVPWVIRARIVRAAGA